MPSEKMWVDWEDGAHLSRSATKLGSFSPLTRDGATNNLGHVTLRPIDGDENFLREVAVAVAVAVTLKVMEVAKPHVEKWVTETAVPAATSAVASAVPAVGSAVASAGSAVGSAAISVGSAIGSVVASAGSAVGTAAVSAGSAVGSAAVSAGSAVASAGSAVGSTASSAWNRLTRKKGKPVVEVESHTAVEAAPADAALVQAVPVEAGVVEVMPVDASHDVAAAIEAYRAGMSRAEARQRIVAALSARLFSEQQIAIVRNARIEDGGDTPELDSATLASMQKQIGESVQLILETAPALLGEDGMADLRKILGPARAEEGGQPERRV
ncbi:hypothetical protein AB0M46_27140 [Dactylosporangium sp. NPDC051485]|uniref:hypothetical protein n=1 Tax=Dactylosporangium sp. NPDC051485 TaxID=3154846 RepID=UPI00342FB000